MSVALEWSTARPARRAASGACGASAPSVFGGALPSHAVPVVPGPAGRQRHLRVVPPPPAPVRRPVRLTRRGRLVRTLAVFTALMVVALMKLVPLAEAAWLRVDHQVTVSGGQSLTDVAARELPGIPADQAIRAIQLLNDLPNGSVYAGQTLLIPAR